MWKSNIRSLLDIFLQSFLNLSDDITKIRRYNYIFDLIIEWKNRMNYERKIRD